MLDGFFQVNDEPLDCNDLFGLRIPEINASTSPNDLISNNLVLTLYERYPRNRVLSNDSS